MEEITIITAFFDIGRGGFSTLSRSIQQYIDYFAFWAGIQNRVIIYTSPEIAEEVRKIRDGYGLSDRTEIVEIKNVFSLHPELYENYKRVSQDGYFKNSRLVKNALSNQADYDYVMNMKYYVLDRAVRDFKLEGMVCWLDFGFNHGGKIYSHPEDFHFLWKTGLSREKVHLFALNKNYTKPIHVLLRSLQDSLQGSLIILHTDLAAPFYREFQAAADSLISIGQIDDDQLMLVLALQNNPNMYHVHHTYWHLGLREQGGEHLRIVPGYGQKNVKWLLNDIRSRLRYAGFKIQFLFRFMGELWKMPHPVMRDVLTESEHD